MLNYFSELQNEFPRVYPSYPYCGFYIPDGWKDLIHRLSKELNEYLISNPDIDFVVDQVKSKHSTLRFYYTCSDLNVQTIVEKYENESGNICEVCGKSAKLINKNGWLYTLCEDCENADK